MRIGILVAIPEEIRQFSNREDTGFQLAGNSLFRIPHPEHDVMLIAGGLGKVNSAVASTLLIRELAVELILFSGIAGSLDPSLKPGEVCFGENLIQHDYGSIVGGQMQIYAAGSIPMGTCKNPVFRLESGLKTRLFSGMPKLRPVTILSGDVFVQCRVTRKRLHDEFNAQLIDMESAAVAQTAELFDIPFLAVRAVSDFAGEDSEGLSRENLNKATKAAAEATLATLEVFSSKMTAEPQVE